MIKLRKLIAAALGAALSLSLCLPVSAKSGFKSAEETVSDIVIGWNLGNTLESTGDWVALYTDNAPADYEKAWGNPVTTEAMIKTVKNAGFNAVRVPVTYAKHIDKDGNIDKAWLDRVQEVVDYVMAQDMYCIINVHHDTGTDGWLKASAQKYESSSIIFANIWVQVSERFKDYDDRLLFESFNEIIDDNNNWGTTDDASYDTVNKLNSLFVGTIRSSGGNNAERNLIVNTYAAGGSENTLKNFTVPKDKTDGHLIVEVHNYNPSSFTSDDSYITNPTSKWGNPPLKKRLDDDFAVLDKYSKKYGVPIIIGEFGAKDKHNDGDRAEFAEYFIRGAGKYGIKCFWWDDGGSYELLDRDRCKFIHEPIVEKMVAAAVKSASEVEADAPVAQNTEKRTSELDAAVSGKTVTLSWEKTDNAEVYRVYSYDSTAKKYVRVMTVKGTKATLKNQTTGEHKYKVIAAVKSGRGYKNSVVIGTAKVKISNGDEA